MFARIQPIKIVKIIASLIFILIITQYFSDVHIPIQSLTYSFDADLILNEFHKAKLGELDLENKYQLTAIIIYSKHLSDVRRLVRYYLNTELFKQIIIWNSNELVNLTINHLLTENSSLIPIQIINSKETSRDETKYRACALAQTLACFYADEKWNTTSYIRNLISTFRSDPNVLHTATDLTTYYNNMLWTYFDTNIDLHAGFSWMGTGSIFLREHAQRHLRFLQIHLKDNPELWAFSDVFFSIWLNDIPTQLIVTLYPLTIDQNEQTNGNLSSNQIVDLQRTSSIFAIRRLEYSLRLNQSNTNLTFSRYQSRRFPYLTKSSNSNDNFIFFSNILPIDIEHIPFDISIDVERATYANIPRGPNFIHFVNHNTLKATDNDDKTCWYPRKSVEKGDFFAIDFLSIQTNLTIVLMMNHSEKLQNTLDIRLSFDGQWWISYPFAIQKNSKTNNAIIQGTPRRLTIDSRQFPPELRSFRYIAFNATTHFHENFSVCDVKIFKNL